MIATIIEEKNLMSGNDEETFIITLDEDEVKSLDNQIFELAIDAIKFGSFNTTNSHSKFARESGYPMDPLLTQMQYEYSILKIISEINTLSTKLKLNSLTKLTGETIFKALWLYLASFLRVCHMKMILVQEHHSPSFPHRQRKEYFIKLLKKSSFYIMLKWIFEEELLSKIIVPFMSHSNKQFIHDTLQWILSQIQPSKDHQKDKHIINILVDISSILNETKGLFINDFDFDDFFKTFQGLRKDLSKIHYHENDIKDSLIFKNENTFTQKDIYIDELWLQIQSFIVAKNGLLDVNPMKEKLSRRCYARLVQKLYHPGGILFHEESSAKGLTIDPCPGPYGVRKRLKMCHLNFDQSYLKDSSKSLHRNCTLKNFPLREYLPGNFIANQRPMNLPEDNPIAKTQATSPHMSDWSFMGNISLSDVHLALVEMQDSRNHWKIRLIDLSLSSQTNVRGNLYLTENWLIFEPSYNSPYQTKLPQYATDTQRIDPTKLIYPLTSVDCLMKCHFEFKDSAVQIEPNKWFDSFQRIFVFSTKRDRDKFIDNMEKKQRLFHTTNLTSAKPYVDQNTMEIFDRTNLLLANKLIEVKVKPEALEFWRTKNLWLDIVLWLEGIYTNFEYLMVLNRASDRNFDDIMQYPIFPWIIKDFNSPILDLTNHQATFRKLHMPIGCQSEERINNVLKRFQDFQEILQNDLSINNPIQSSCFFPSYCNNLVIVLHFLFRMNPYTHLLLRFQDLRFDLPERSFHDFQTEYELSTNHINFVKELIPELFYNPVFLNNTQELNLVDTQSGLSVENVILPKWSSGSPDIFINIHRFCLETNYVRDKLPSWIDLIFGKDSSGDNAKERYNLYHPLVYGNLNTTLQLDCPSDRYAMKSVIRNYGQVPVKLFSSTKHPLSKKSNADAAVEGSELLVVDSSISPLETVVGLEWADFVASPEGWSSSRYRKVSCVTIQLPQGHHEFSPKSTFERINFFAWKITQNQQNGLVYLHDNLNIEEILEKKENEYFTNSTGIPFIRVAPPKESLVIQKGDWQLNAIVDFDFDSITYLSSVYDEIQKQPITVHIEPVTLDSVQVLHVKLSTGKFFFIDITCSDNYLSIYGQKIMFMQHFQCSDYMPGPLNRQNLATIIFIVYHPGSILKKIILSDNFVDLQNKLDSDVNLPRDRFTNASVAVSTYAFNEFKSRITRLAVSIPYKYFVVGYKNGRVQIWDLFIEHCFIRELEMPKENLDELFSLEVVGLTTSFNTGDIAVARLLTISAINLSLYHANGSLVSNRRIDFLVEIPKQLDEKGFQDHISNVAMDFSTAREGLAVNCLVLGSIRGRIIWLNHWTLETIFTYKIKSANIGTIKILKFLPEKSKIGRFMSVEAMARQLIASDGSKIFHLYSENSKTIENDALIFYEVL